MVCGANVVTVEHVVMFSGGAGSAVAAARVVERHGPNSVVLLCADTRSEADDWRPFVDAAAAHIGARLVILDAGRDIWELALEQRAVPRQGMDFCSRLLKREPLAAWCRENAPDAVQHFGFTWDEAHRFERVRARSRAPVDAPCLWDVPPFRPLDKAQVLTIVAGWADVPTPHAYHLGLPHNNCLRYGCVRGGQGYWERLSRLAPDAYRRAEVGEERVRAVAGDYAVLRERVGGVSRPLPLRVFRERLEADPLRFAADDFGSCGCFEPPPGGPTGPTSE